MIINSSLKLAVLALQYSHAQSPACLFSSPVDAYNPDYKQYPKFRKAKAISFTQEAGDLFIIPTGWFHQVRCHQNQCLTPLKNIGNTCAAMWPEDLKLWDQSTQ